MKQKSLVEYLYSLPYAKNITQHPPSSYVQKLSYQIKIINTTLFIKLSHNMKLRTTSSCSIFLRFNSYSVEEET